MLLIKRNDPNQISNLLDFGTVSSTVSENDPQDMSYSKHNSYHYSNQQGRDEMNESQYSEYTAPRNQGTIEHNDYDADSYNSFNFESRIADYGKKKNTILKTEDYGTVSSMAGTGTALPYRPQGFIPTKSRKIFEYTKDDYPSEATDSDQRDLKNAENKYFVSNNSYSDYDYESGNIPQTVNEIRPGQNNIDIDYNSVFDSNSNYFISGVDPK